MTDPFDLRSFVALGLDGQPSAALFVLRDVAPSSKKNSRRPGHRRLRDGRLQYLPQLRPSATYEAFEASALALIGRTWKASYRPIDRDPRGNWRPVAVDVLFLTAQRFDTSGMLEAVGDMLQRAKVIRNDYAIVRGRGVRSRSDRSGVLILLQALREDCDLVSEFVDRCQRAAAPR